MRLIPRRANRRLARDVDIGEVTLRSIGPLRTLALVAPWHRDADLMSGLTLHAAPRSLLGWLIRAPRPNGVTRFAYAIVPKSQPRPVGIITVEVGRHGWAGSHLAISDARWRGRIAVDARAALLDLYFREGGVTIFSAHIDSRNAASIFIYKRLGFRVANIIPHSATDPVTGRSVDRIVFVLERAEWERRRAAATTRQAS